VQIKFQALFSLVAFEDIDALQDASHLLHARSARMLFASVSIELDGAGEQQEQEPRQTTSGERTPELNGTVTYELRRPVLPIFHDHDTRSVNATASHVSTSPVSAFSASLPPRATPRQQREERSRGGKAAVAKQPRAARAMTRPHVKAHELSTQSAVEEWLWSSPSSQHHTPQHACTLPLLALKSNVTDGAVTGKPFAGMALIQECIEEFDSTESLGLLNYSPSSPSLTSSGEGVYQHGEASMESKHQEEKGQVREAQDESEHAAQKEEAKGKLEEKTEVEGKVGQDENECSDSQTHCLHHPASGAWV